MRIDLQLLTVPRLMVLVLDSMNSDASATEAESVATGGGEAAPMAARPPTGSAWPDRRRRRQAARNVQGALLVAAYARVEQLEAVVCDLKLELQVCQDLHVAAAGQAVALAEAYGDMPAAEPLRGEVAERLALAAPSLVSGLARAAGTQDGAATAPITQRRRNTASHNFELAASVIRTMTGTQLNAAQRGARKATGLVCTVPTEPPTVAHTEAATRPPSRWRETSSATIVRRAMPRPAVSSA